VSAPTSGVAPVRVLSIPAGHVYVRHLSSPVGDDVVRLPDPPVPGSPRAAQWWPPQALDADWVEAHREEFDLVHLHFGFDARSPGQLSDWVERLAVLGKPLVYTVHDLRNPHHETATLHAEQLEVLIPAASALITLTEGARSAIRRQYGREAHVLPHPHVVPEQWLLAPRPRRHHFTVGVHLKSLRANMDPLPVLEVLAKVVPAIPDGRLRVDVHCDVMTPGTQRHDPEVARAVSSLAEDEHVDVEIHDFFTDDELWDYLSGLDVSVLPYRFGTHSGWLEACHDLGTVAAVPDCGFYDQQRPCLSYHLGPEGLDAASLEAAVQEAYANPREWRAAPEERHEERVALAAAHRRIYAEVLDQ
jgi:glycosyltransferase involved in cell wall biosynthesis